MAGACDVHQEGLRPVHVTWVGLAAVAGSCYGGQGRFEARAAAETGFSSGCRVWQQLQDHVTAARGVSTSWKQQKQGQKRRNVSRLQ